MRRRALLAASAASGGGESNTYFYAEFYFDFCEESPLGGYCERAADALSLECYEKGKTLIENYGLIEGFTMVLQNPIDFGFEVYLEGELCTVLKFEYKTLYLGFSASIHSDGLLTHEY